MSESSPAIFLTRFVWTALLGSAAIILAAPFVRTWATPLPEWLAEPSRSLRASPALADAADRLAAALLWSPAARRTAVSATTTATAVAQSPRWAVIIAAHVPAYRDQGQFWKRLDAGTIVTVHGTHASSVGTVAACRLSPPSSAEADEFLIRRDQLDLYEGSPDTLTFDARALYAQHGRLRAELTKTKTGTTGRDRTDNPNWPTYSRARDAYRQGAEVAKSLQARFDKSVGSERQQLVDELRRLKVEEAQQSQTLAAARRAYDAWNASHPIPNGSSNPRAKALEAELASLTAKLPMPATAP